MNNASLVQKEMINKLSKDINDRTNKEYYNHLLSGHEPKLTGILNISKENNNEQR